MAMAVTMALEGLGTPAELRLPHRVAHADAFAKCIDHLQPTHDVT